MSLTTSHEPVSGAAEPPVSATLSRPTTPTSAGLRETLSAWAGKLLYWTLLVVALISPFEAGYPPLGRIYWAKFTNLEIALTLMGVVWAMKVALDPAARRRALRMPLLLPFLAFLGAIVLSTAFAEYNLQGAQFLYRMGMGLLICLVVWEALTGARRLLAALGALVLGGAVSALLGLLEFAPWVDIQPWLQMFKPQPTTVGGMLRLSGSFEYANGAAVYFEMVLPVLTSLIILFSRRRLLAELSLDRISEAVRKVVLVLLLALTGLFTMALILTFSRAAWVATFVGLGVIVAAAIVRGRGPAAGWFRPTVLKPVGVALGVMALGTLYIALTHPLLMLRLTGENDRSWYRNSIQAQPVPPLSAGQTVTVPVTLRNLGPMTWHARRLPNVHLSYHWVYADQDASQVRYAVFEGARTALPHDVGPGESITVDAVLTAPPKPGEYYLEWDLVHEDVAWFEYKTGLSAERTRHTIAEALTTAAVTLPANAAVAPADSSYLKNADTSIVSRRELWSAAFKMVVAHPVTGVGPDGFRFLYGKYAGKAQWNRNIYTNNTYIEMFTNLGLVGGLAFLWLIGLAAWRAARNILRQPPNALWLLCLGVTASFFAHLLHGLADYFLFATPLYFIFWFVLAASALYRNYELPATNLELGRGR